MPKIRSHSGTKKRARRTGSGKVVMSRGSRNHLLQQKSKRQKSLNSTLELSSSKQAKNIKKLIPYS
ncbi:50S ribosomal protein L35 [Candidatus Peribacteria bacterium]|nr:50S ribosomal protein L35 [Candidatus Peribacteria bacterium]MBT4020840.1 50S ribosomal protein L35 [Candidatus Peribacteria bacterium]MBT4241129.1 50S ribosomal protein L35 [Candidatus Peribacteria bacterium]MBT4473851.1 50S ribosomal protein L35 [Candidatus Peribacteria bacterium]